MRSIRSVFSTVFLLSLALALAGCSTKALVNTLGTLYGLHQVSVQADAAGLPLAGANLQLYAAGTTGYGGASTPLLAAGLTTDAAGRFVLPAGTTCTAGAELYLAATTPAAVFITVLGPCPSDGVLLSASGPVTALFINENTTAAAAFALRSFATDATHIGAPSDSLSQSALAAAFTAAAQMDDIQTNAPAHALTGAPSSTQAQLNSLTTSLAACASGAGPCNPLFAPSATAR